MIVLARDTQYFRLLDRRKRLVFREDPNLAYLLVSPVSVGAAAARLVPIGDDSAS